MDTTDPVGHWFKWFFPWFYVNDFL